MNNILETTDISNDGVLTSVSHGIPKLVRNIRNAYLGLTVSETEKKPRTINQNFGKNFIHYDTNLSFGFRPKQAILPPTHKFGLCFVEILNNANFLDIFDFRYTYGKRKSF